MTIKRISYPNGKVLPLDIPATVSLRNFMLRDRRQARSVTEGEHNIRLELTKDVYDYRLIANADGSGELRMIVKDTEDTREARKVRTTEDRTIRLPQDERLFALIGPKKDDPRYHVFEILYHELGRSPRRHKER